MYTALATSWLLFSGPTNYIALSTAAFFGIGMYTAAGGIDLVPYPLLILAAGIAGAALAAVVGLATLRVSGVYFVIFSLGLAELVRQIMTWLQHVLGTMSGLYVTVDRSELMYYWQLLAADGRGFPGRLAHRPLAARLCAAHHRQRRSWSPSIAASTPRAPRSCCSSSPACSLRSPARWWRRAGAMSSRSSPSARSFRFRW